MTNPIINGVEVQVGQVWETRSGDLIVISSIDSNDDRYPIRGSTETYTKNGEYSLSQTRKSDDLAKLIGHVTPIVTPHAEQPEAKKPHYGRPTPEWMLKEETPRKLMLSVYEMVRLVGATDKYLSNQERVEDAVDFIKAIEANTELMERVR